MYISRLTVENVRCFERTAVEFHHPTSSTADATSHIRSLGNVTLLLGDNGAGKTSVLRAVALAALGPVLASGSGFTPYSLVRRSARGTAARARITATVHVDRQDGIRPHRRDINVELRPRDDGTEILVPAKVPAAWLSRMRDAESPAFLVLGYSANRRVHASGSSAPDRRSLRYRRVASLFEERASVVPLSAWLPRWKSQNPGRHKQVINLINRLLPEPIRLRPEPRRGEYLFEHDRSVVPYAALSDGYRAYITWIGDLLYHVCMGCPSGVKLVENRGIVLIDEIDLHVHPEWQRTIVPTLAHALPNLQFILTSHSPIVAGTLAASDVRIVRTTERGDSVVEPLDQELYGLSADQILTGATFGLKSTRNVATTEWMRALNLRARRGDADAARDLIVVASSGPAAVERFDPARPPSRQSPTRR